MNNQNKKDFSILVDPANGQWGGTTGISCDLGAGNSGKTFACTPHAIFTNGTTDVDIGGQTVNAQAK
jgi:hypothetical protein